MDVISIHAAFTVYPIMRKAFKIIALLIIFPIISQAQTEWSVSASVAIEELYNPDAVYPLRADIELGLSARHALPNEKGFLFGGLMANTRPRSFETQANPTFRYVYPYFCTELGYGHHVNPKIEARLFGYTSNPSNVFYFMRKFNTNLSQYGLGAKVSTKLGPNRLAFSFRQELNKSIPWSTENAKTFMRNYSISLEIPFGKHEE